MLIRPQRHQDESDAGFLLRMASINGLPPRWIEDSKGRRITSPKLGLTRCCPLCLKSKTPYWQESWSNSMGICHHHQCWLVDQCSACGYRLSWRQLNFLHCRCGADLRSVAAPSLSLALSALLCKKWEVLGHVLERTANTERIQLAEVLGSLDLFGLGGKPLKRASSTSLKQHMAIVERGALILSHPDTEIPCMLDRIRAFRAEDQQAQLFSEAWPGLQRILKKRLHGEALNWLLHKIDQFAEASLGSMNPVQGRRASKKRSFGSSELAKRLQMRFDRLPDLLQQSALSIPQRRSSSGRKMLISTEAQANTLSKHLQDRITARTAQRRYGLTSSRLEVLADASHIQRIESRYSRSSIDELISKISPRNGSYVALQPTKTAGTTTLHKALQMLVPLGHTLSFFEALLSRKIVAHRYTQSAHHLHNWEVSTSDLQAWLSALNRSAELMSIPLAADRLGLKQQVIYHLVKVGLLPTIRHRIGRRVARAINLVDIEKFQQTYITLSALALQHGIDFRSAKSWAQDRKVKFASGPGVDGGRQFICVAPTRQLG